MAVSNAIGSNVFDINLGLGLPILIRILVDRGQAFSLLSAEQTVQPHTMHTATLLTQAACLPYPLRSSTMLACTPSSPTPSLACSCSWSSS